jgi:beta-glucosidase-like glycosyl hydrolase/CubicO group peptidase (beta-lactamase class C family)
LKLIKAILILLFSAFNILPSGEEAAITESGNRYKLPSYPPFAQKKMDWADSLLSTMSVEEKIGQLFMIAAWSDKDEAHYQMVDYYVEHYHIGGVIFFQGDPVKQAELTNRYQKLAKYPLLVGIDAEWGLGMRLDSTISFPRQLLLGAIQDDEMIYRMGREIGRQHRRMGIHINFAPVVDVNVNPDNPVINDRSFGEDRENVARKGIAYMKGLQDEKILACAKHFPGHGDTDVDSHYDLPVILHDTARLDSIELYPFRKMIREGVSSVMVAHLSIPSLDSVRNRPSTLSEKIVSGLLERELGFRGLIVTDALNMKGVTKYYEAGESSLQAFLAGNDILLFPDNVVAAVNQLRTAFTWGEYSEEDLDKRVRKILLAKQWAGLKKREFVETADVVKDLNTGQARELHRGLVEAAITVVRDSASMIPLTGLDRKRMASVTIGQSSSTPFTRMLDNYDKVSHFFIAKNAGWPVFERVLNSLSHFDVVLANVQNMSRYSSKEYGVTANTEMFLQQLQSRGNAILTVFGSPYSLVKFPGWSELIVAYEQSAIAQEMAAQVIFGGRSASGRLPVSAADYHYAEGVSTPEPSRLAYGSIEELGLEEADLAKVDSIILATLSIEATPGCQVLIAKDNLVFYNRAFGRHTYKSPQRKVRKDDLYDIASITKISSTMALVMKLVEEGRLDIEETLGKYMELPETSNKHDLVLKDILAHQAGLWPWIPFYLETLDSNDIRLPEVYNDDHNDEYPIIVCDDLYCSLVYQDSMWHKIHHSNLLPTTDYKYSDLGFYYLKEIVERIYQMPLERAVQEVVYKPMGMNLSTFKPLEAGFTKDEIVPTETDVIFRGRTIHGYVHDPGAAMMGGVGGHAGVFSNANDLAKYMQMLLNGGIYGGHRYYDTSTVEYFTTAHFEGNRRGLGFDKPDPERKWGSACDSASLASFGHTGFTGTMAFADPELELVFIFLSNRIHPSADNRKLIEENSRTQIHQAVYDIFLRRPEPAEEQ